MITCVNRQSEKKIISEAFKALQNNDDEYLLRTPIIDFFGVEGIGKTAFLEYIEDQCKKQSIHCILIDAQQEVRQFSYAFMQRVSELATITFQPLDENKDLLQPSLDAITTLLEKGAVVIILDNVDETDEETLEYITGILREMVNDRNILVILSSKRGVLFDSERSISRKLTSLQLNVLDRKSCEDYLDLLKTSLKPKERTYILNWTRGYPLAMEVMTKAITESALDPALPEHQKVLVELLIKQVIDEKIFAELTSVQCNQYKEALTILSVPRHFNLLIMQKLIKEFASDELKKENSLAYMNLPGSIKNDTGVLSWDIFKGGYVIDAPVRNIFLLKISIEQAERYTVLHQFLAQLNRDVAKEVTDVDRIQYLCEYLYHSAHVKRGQEFIQILTQVQQEITEVPFDSLETFEAFEDTFERLLQDNEGEFLETLGTEAQGVEALIYQHLAEMNRERAAHITPGEDHFYHLGKFFMYLVKDPMVTDERAVWTPAIQKVVAGKPTNYLVQFVDELSTNEALKKELGSHFKLLAELIAENL